MAENKKSVLLYCDIIHTVEKLDDEKAGLLFKHYLRYINDEHPIAPNLLVEIAFEPMKQNLKRDLKKWNGYRDKRSDAGKKSAGKKAFEKWIKANPKVYNISKDDHLYEAGKCMKYQNESYDNGYTVDWFYNEYCINFHQQMATKSTSVESVESDSTNPTVIVKDIVKDNVNVNDTINNKERKKVFNFRKELLAFGFKENLVNEWLKVRKTKKATNTETAFRNFIIEIHKSNLDYNIILEKCVTNSWAGFKNAWLEKEKSSAKKEKRDAAEIILEKYGID